MKEGTAALAAACAHPEASEDAATEQAKRVSARQASRGTLKLIRQHAAAEEAAFHRFERAAVAAMRANAPLLPAPLKEPKRPGSRLRAPGARRRGRPPAQSDAAAASPQWAGPALESLLARVRGASTREQLAVGTPVWARMTGWTAWPGLVWSLDLCSRATWPAILRAYAPGRVLVRHFGDHSSSWVKPKQLSAWDEPAGSAGAKLEALRAWGKKASKARLVAATEAELAGRSADAAEEVARMERLGHAFQVDFFRAAARARHHSLLRPNSSQQEAAAAAAAGGGAGSGAASAAAAASAVGRRLTVNVAGSCEVCLEALPDLLCAGCKAWVHALCCSPPALSAADLPPGAAWACPSCGGANSSGLQPEEELLALAGFGPAGVEAERMGLTPDHIIAAAAFRVFQLPRPTPEQPFIAGLLDPACNSKLCPNIPAERLYDKRDDGLKPANSWRGFHILLNPDFKAQVQWRFVNRAIDEVESGNCPACILICRNSTDTHYFQRLRPYPRILLRRSACAFKDYVKSPPGFGIVVFCIARRGSSGLYRRFLDAFAAWGEPNLPIDCAFLSDPAGAALLARLRSHAEQHSRDHWAQCSTCGVWRIVPWAQLAGLKGEQAWTCSRLRPPFTSCATPQSKAELAGANLPWKQEEADEEGAEGEAGQASDADEAASSQAQQQQVQSLARHADNERGDVFAALQRALEQQAAVAAATAAAAQADAADAAAAFAKAALPSHGHDTRGGGRMTAGAAKQPSRRAPLPQAMTADALAAAGPANSSPGGSERSSHSRLAHAPAASAAELLEQLGPEAARLQHQAAARYVCKAAAGQVSLLQAQQLCEQAAGVCEQGAKRACSAASSGEQPASSGEPPAKRLCADAAGSHAAAAVGCGECSSATAAAEGDTASPEAASPGLAFLAQAACQLVARWLQRLAAEQLAACDARQALIQRALQAEEQDGTGSDEPGEQRLGSEGMQKQDAQMRDAFGAGRGEPATSGEAEAGNSSQLSDSSQHAASTRLESVVQELPAQQPQQPQQPQAAAWQAASSAGPVAVTLPGTAWQPAQPDAAFLAAQGVAVDAALLAALPAAELPLPPSSTGSVHATRAGQATSRPERRPGKGANRAAEAAQAPGPPARPSALLAQAPLVLSQGAVFRLAGDPLLRAVLLEQPAVMGELLQLLARVCAQRAPAASQGAQQQVTGPGPDPSSRQQVDLHAPGPEADAPAVEALAAQHPCRVASSSLPRRQDVLQAAAAAGVEPGEALALLDSDEEDQADLSGLELARQARLAANQAYLSGLGLSPSALQAGLVGALAPDHHGAVLAARKLAQQEATSRAARQLAKAQRRLDARRLARRGKETQLRAALAALVADEAAAAAAVATAQQTLADVADAVGGGL